MVKYVMTENVCQVAAPSMSFVIPILPSATKVSAYQDAVKLDSPATQMPKFATTENVYQDAAKLDSSVTLTLKSVMMETAFKAAVHQE